MQLFKYLVMVYLCLFVFFFQAEDGIRDAQESRGLGDVYKRQHSFYVGQRVVCVDDLFNPERLLRMIECNMKAPVKLSLIHI